MSQVAIGFSGFWNSKSGVAYHANWMTPQADVHGADWAISSDQTQLYRSNGVQRSTNTNGVSGSMCTLGVNLFDPSDFAITDVLLYNRELTLLEIQEVEAYLGLKLCT